MSVVFKLQEFVLFFFAWLNLLVATYTHRLLCQTEHQCVHIFLGHGTDVFYTIFRHFIFKMYQ